jgi:pyrroline-5-carboxylate reductase
VTQEKIHFIGGGQMAEAIIRASISNNTLSIDQISVSDINEARLQFLSTKYGIDTKSSQEQGLSSADLIVVAVRPQDDLTTLGQIVQQFASPTAVIVSIVAGVTNVQLAGYFGAERSIIRVIPNTLTDTGYGYSGVALNAYASRDQVEPFLLGFGKVQYLDEAFMDIFTGFGVAGPNYIYFFIESFVDAGVLAGLPREQAWSVALENMMGSVAMLQQTGLHPRQLLDINNSPGGVGMHGLYELNNSDFAAGLQRSVLAAVKRTTELGVK